MMQPSQVRAVKALQGHPCRHQLTAWDFASATRQTVAVSDQVATYVLGLAEQMITPEQRERAGFDPAIPISGDAPALDRLVAFSGRAA